MARAIGAIRRVMASLRSQLAAKQRSDSSLPRGRFTTATKLLHTGRALRDEAFQTYECEIADVSLTHETIASCNYPSPQASLRNGIEEADGSIPFSSTEVPRLFFSRRRFETIFGSIVSS